MTNFVRRLLIVVVGMLGALLAWPLIEACASGQGAFPSYLVYSVAVGVVAGAAMGAFFGSTEGLLGASPRKALAGALSGVATGIVGGVLGGLAAQAILFLSGESLMQSSSRTLDAPFILARAAGWAIVGLAIGVSEGVRARSPKKAALGATGGIVGGFLGGLLFVWIGAAAPLFLAGRLIALLAMAGLIGLLYCILERRFAVGSFKALNGPLKGKEYIVNQRRLSLGSDGGRDIVLRGYRDVAPLHAQVKVERGGKLLIERKDGALVVNEKELPSARLELDDVVKIGSAKFLYGYFG
jgi:CDP-diglyceride synthetase